ncbi:uncharacterized protein TM35_000073330 [Trypanosoma theileri]|uniref:AAA+ ATPase domain-containing protein n=1 Tax=Trypanosoma theileri TaxID=67003 RepID=A0A1X0P2X6_9TRYP|nr:uncharacterized protein TM35_000073330 [Trypanosoma theileri]ORC90909.1 hypothetical protein TM35_000073330 [Trypanosoma theileri]
MGGKLSKQEELFVLHRWPELLENAMATDVEYAVAAAGSAAAGSDNSNSNNNKRHSSTSFRMSFQEWQALITLLDNTEPSELPSRLCAGVKNTTVTTPILVVMIHACCWFDGSITAEVLVERLQNFQKNVLKSIEESGERRSSEENAELELADDALCILLELAQDKKNLSSSQKRTPQVKHVAIDKLIAWDRSKKPLVTLAHTFIVGVIASLHSNPRYAETAVQSFRHLQESIGESAATVTPRGGRGAACNIIKWDIMQRIENVLVRRQRETDVLDLLSIKERWWLPPTTPSSVSTNQSTSRRNSNNSSSSMASTSVAASSGTTQLSNLTPEERWALVPSQYIGQEHIWATLQTHFLSSDVFNAEKPTVIVFFGPSGFGKSEMARRIACVIHGKEPSNVESSGKLVHIHLPSFCTRDSIYSLVDPPAAHVGEGVLLTALRKNDDAVVVLDEFEKGTADAIQNLWLSAFQKKGTLRSLKDASRSVSTEKTTFILTCNIASDTILRNKDKYLRATAEEQAAMRAEWTEVCKEVCRKTMHDPFVNRVDYFFPFVPYTEEEKERFIQMQLRRILLDQRSKDRHIYITPRMVKAIAAKLQSFHASTIEGVVRPLLVEVIQKKWTGAVLTVEEHVSGTVFVAIPTTTTTTGETKEGGSVISWDSIPDGERALAVYDNQEESKLSTRTKRKTTTTTTTASSSSTTTTTTKSVGVDDITTSTPKGKEKEETRTKTVETKEKVLRDKQPVVSSIIHHTPTVIEKEKILQLEKNVQKDLELELKKANELILQKDMEITYLKEKVLCLEKLLAVLLISTLTCLFVLSLIVGVKIVLVISFFIILAIYLLIGMRMELLLGALRVLYGILGPFGSALAVVALSLWTSQAIRNSMIC